MTEQNTREDVAAQAAAEMQKKGRDGAYLELDVAEIAEASRNGSLDKAKMINLSGYRIELSSPAQVEEFKKVFAAVSSLPESEGMADHQIGFAVFRSIFDHGLMSFLPPEEKRVDIQGQV